LKAKNKSEASKAAQKEKNELILPFGATKNPFGLRKTSAIVDSLESKNRLITVSYSLIESYVYPR